MKKKDLSIMVTMLFIVGIIAVSYVFIVSMSPSKGIVAKAEYTFDISKIEEGKLQIFNIEEKPLFVFQPTQEQWQDITYLDSHVFNTQSKGYDEVNNIFVHWGVGTRFGCGLVLKQKGDTVFGTDENNRIWLGGYFDPCHSSSYDFSGRTIRSYKHTFNGFDAQVDNLASPKFIINGHELIIKLL